MLSVASSRENGTKKDAGREQEPSPPQTKTIQLKNLMKEQEFLDRFFYRDFYLGSEQDRDLEKIESKSGPSWYVRRANERRCLPWR
jgi:hypothetical protein